MDDMTDATRARFLTRVHTSIVGNPTIRAGIAAKNHKKMECFGSGISDIAVGCDVPILEYVLQHERPAEM